MNRKELFEQIKLKKSYLCIGLDTDPEKLPEHLLRHEDPVFEFNRQIIEATKKYCVAYKPNTAFYEAMGPKGLVSLEKTFRAIPSDTLVIADAKRGDIGNTSGLYARAFFDYYKVDAITVAPYMGKDSVMPFLEYKGKWVILLALTSNSGSMDFQLAETCTTLHDQNEMLFEHVLRTSSKWGSADQMMFVVGATHPELFKKVREIVPDHFLLVPGVGAQGGQLEEISANGFNSQCGLLVNSSRQIIYASKGEDFATKAGEEARQLQNEMSLLIDKFLK